MQGKDCSQLPCQASESSGFRNHDRQNNGEDSGGWKCAIVGVPWRGLVSAGSAWCGLFVKHIILKGAEKAEPYETPWHTYDGTPTPARKMAVLRIRR